MTFKTNTFEEQQLQNIISDLKAVGQRMKIEDCDSTLLYESIGRLEVLSGTLPF